ncbi:MAG: protease inhibitor I42 family protein [Alphaproteobacteria bacterium]|nr:protease inhibitor I42 family protein [Alphaproteobacteria bacterium]
MKKLTGQFNTATVKKGETFAIELGSNPSTGYSWDVQLKAGKASLVKTDYKPDSKDPMIIGGGGKEIYVFKAEETGTVDIEAVYRRPWDKSSAGKPLRFGVTVRP